MNESYHGDVNARAVAARIIGEWRQTGRFPDRLIAPGARDRAFLVEVVYGVARWRRALDWVVRRCADGRPDRTAVPYLLVGLYQILIMDHVAPYAAVNETVAGARAAGGKATAGFVNAMLRRALREADALRKKLASQPLGIRESHPDILVRRWARNFGESASERLCRWNNTRPSVVLRVNTQKIGFRPFLASLEEAGLCPVPHPAAPEAYAVLPHGVAVRDVPGYDDGLFVVQDPSTRTAVALLNPRPGDLILDACAAPGGKAVLIAEIMRGQGTIIAMDRHQDRLDVLKENVRRLKVDCVVPVLGDASLEADVAKACGQKRFERILLDVPCSNTGVLARRPDARWRFSADRLSDLARTQRTLLDTTARFLAQDGVLVYSTCSLEPEENADLVRDWLRDHPEFALQKSIAEFPPDAETDGVYVAALHRRGTSTSLPPSSSDR